MTDKDKALLIDKVVELKEWQPIATSSLNKLLSFIDSMQEDPVSDDFKKFEEDYLNKVKDEILCVYDRHAGLVDGANWQKEQIMKEGVDLVPFDIISSKIHFLIAGTCEEVTLNAPSDLLRGLEVNKNVKLILIKDK